MEVRRVEKPGINSVQKKEQQATESVRFSEVMAKGRENIVYERMAKLRQDIEAQGQKLAKSQTIEDFKKYKQLVKSFMEDAVKNGLQLEEQRGLDWRGRTKVYKIVKEVDKKLIDLANTVLDKEEKGLEILSLVGEIQGLLINIYT
ncbi:YaaR family protein [Bacillus sp. FJAT-49711]|uniref:YaaR family protein n=1 Tax=Bacillus sp. FJAT-49711 TaxID=2833585 RepID=UPI001BC91903|nr:YaaR family protein [Bacillus sp. FJAT-49711]MBS4219328.1 YaaR family protein [Bacillus sp. FJAT-49711]